MGGTSWEKKGMRRWRRWGWWWSWWRWRWRCWGWGAGRGGWLGGGRSGRTRRTDVGSSTSLVFLINLPSFFEAWERSDWETFFRRNNWLANLFFVGCCSYIIGFCLSVGCSLGLRSVGCSAGWLEYELCVWRGKNGYWYWDTTAATNLPSWSPAFTHRHSDGKSKRLQRTDRSKQSIWEGTLVGLDWARRDHCRQLHSWATSLTVLAAQAFTAQLCHWHHQLFRI